MTDHIYARQQALNLQTPDTVTVIGCGGVGSWVALDLALAGVEKLYLVDHDHIEEHNLNRTPFKQSQVEMDKTVALTELITERRLETETVPVTDRIEETAGAFREEMRNNPVIDCRDHASPLPDGISEQVVLTAGYDGFEFTLHLNPDYESIWGDEDTEYETVPSFVAPPQFLASIVTTIVSVEDLQEGEDLVNTADMRHTIRNLLDTEPLKTSEYAQRMADYFNGDETEYVNELVGLAKEFEATIDSDNAEGMLEAALHRVRQEGDEE